MIDIGANEGLFSTCTRLLFPNSMVHAYEPNQALLPRLKHYSRQVEFGIYMEAVGASSGSVSLEGLQDTQTVRTRATSEPGGIPQVGITEVLTRMGGQIDFLKIDCEGGEWEILNDSQALSGVRRIAMEYHLLDGRSHAGVPETVSNAGFQVLDQKPTNHETGMLYASADGKW